MSKDEHTSSFKDAFKKFLNEEHLDAKFKQKQVIASWERIMGKPIAARTTKMYFKDKTLFVELSSAALKDELNRSRERMLERITEAMGDSVVHQIRFL